jgi:hypothetical protein
MACITTNPNFVPNADFIFLLARASIEFFVTPQPYLTLPVISLTKVHIPYLPLVPVL